MRSLPSDAGAVGDALRAASDAPGVAGAANNAAVEACR